MKHLYTILALLLSFFYAKAQDKTTTTQEVQDTFKTPQYEVVFDDVFLSKRETKSLFKIDVLAFLNILNDDVAGRKGLILEYERKISPVISINSGVFIGRDLFNSARNFTLFVEPRWYLNQEINNLNGTYLGLNIDYSTPQSLGATFKFGLQKRVYNSWYANFNAGLGYGPRLNESGSASSNNLLQFASDFTFGLAFGGGGKKAQIQTCEVFKCSEEEKFLFKIDLKGLIVELNKNNYKSTPIINFEYKLSTSWSINHDFRLLIEPKRINYGTENKRFIAETYIEPRYYYNMKKRIAKGKSVNNLSGNYFSIAAGYRYAKSQFEVIDPNTSYNSGTFITNYFLFIPKFGIQRRIMKNGFIDVNFAPFQYKRKEEKSEYDDKRSKSTSSYSSPFFLDFFAETFPVLDIKVGLAF